jgi:hypothetical protein
MQPSATDLHEAASGRMGLLNPARSNDRARSKHRKERKQDSDPDHGHAKQSKYHETP